MKVSQHVFMLILFMLSGYSIAAEEFIFDVSSYQKKNYRLGGYLEYSLNHQILNQSAAANSLLFINKTLPDSITQHIGIIELNGDYKQDKWQARFNFHAEAYDNELVSDQQGIFYEAVATYQPTTGITLEAGKKAIKWGKGYAWNPVGFVERPKDPNDPDLSREGYVVAAADIIKSFSDDIKTLAFTAAYLPVTEHINEDFGQQEHNNIAAKLYLLYNDTDIDIVFLNQGSRSWRYGFDFSKNINTNFEVHGEWAYLSNVTKQLVDNTGVISTEQDSAQQWLLGVRYLTENDTTIIAEYYRNEAGYNEQQMDDFFSAVDVAYATLNTNLLNSLSKISQQTYLKRNPGKNYLYLRASNKEPFDWLYVTTAVTLITNIDDNSYSITPEISYTGIKDLELRFKAAWLNGDDHSEFGEKRNDRKVEFRLRYYF